MTAKSETVGVALTDEQVVIAQGLFIYEVDYSPEENWRGVRLDNVRKLIDKHESALAELRTELVQAITDAQAARARAERDWRKAQDAEAKHERLITGLEALAGEWLKHAVNYDNEATDVISDVYYAQLTTHADECRSKALKLRTLIPAAANTESEEGYDKV